jgi:ABC-type glycerol-3-phosphate transport system substrate-binding protein
LVRAEHVFGKREKEDAMSKSQSRKVSRRDFIKLAGVGVAATGIAPLLQACGVGTPSAGGAPTATTAGGAAAPGKYKFPASEKTYSGSTLHVAMVNEPKPEMLKSLVPEFETKTGAKVNFEDLPYGTLQEKQLTAVTQGIGAFDIVHVDCTWLGQYAGQNWLISLDDLISQTDPAVVDIKDFVPRLVEETDVWEGKYYGLPFDTSIMMFYYRTDLLDKYALKPPVTWDELYTVAKTITDAEKANGVYGLTLMAKRSVQLGCTYANLLGSYGGYWYDKNYKATLDQPEAIHALEMLVKLVSVCNPGSLAQDYDEGDATFANGSAAMFMQWNDSIPRYKDPQYSKIGGKWAAALVPGVTQADGSIKRTPCIGGWNTGILSDSKNKELAWEFLLWAVSKDMERRLAVAQPPARSSVLNDPAMVSQYPEYAPMLKSLEVAFGRPRIKVYSQITDNVEAALSQAVSGQMSPDAALKQVNPVVDGILKAGGFQS